MKDIIVTVLSLTVVNNYVASKVMGVPNAFVKDTKKINHLGLFTLLTIAISGLLGLVIANALNGLGFGFMSLPVNALVSALVALILSKVLKADKTELVLTIFNAAVIGCVCLLQSQGIELAQSYLYTIGAGVSYLVAMYMVAAVKSRIDEKAIPSNFKGLPIEILALGIIALAVLAFK